MKCRRTALVWFLILASYGGLRATAAELVEPAKLDALVNSILDSGWIQGAAIGLINEQGTQTAGYGHVSDANSAAPDADTVFEIGSITKVYTGLVLAQMVEQDTIALEDSVQQLLGDSIKVPKGKVREITLVDLSTHSSGLPRMPGNFKPKDPSDPFADYTLEQLAEFLAKHKLRREPGAQSEYSNLGVGLLGHALARKAGTSYEELVRERICEPLDMTDTRITLDDDLRARLAQGHDYDGNPAANWHLPTLAGAGALRSTVNDMLKFLSANMGLSKTPFDAAIAASHAKHFDLPGGGGIALGWHLQGDGVIWHNGGTGGYHSYTCFWPKKQVGVVVLANTSVAAVDQLGSRLLQLLTTGDAKPLALPRAMTLDAAALDRFVGEYKSPPIPTITVALDGDTLSLQIAGQPKLRLYAKSETRFFTRASADINVSFESDEAGGVKRLVIHQGGQNVPVARVEDSKPQE